MAQGRMIKKSITADSKVKQMDDYCKLYISPVIIFVYSA